jgi:hypothetical protein
MTLIRWDGKKIAAAVGLVAIAVLVGIKVFLNQKNDASSHARRSRCQPAHLQGTPLEVERVDAGVHVVSDHVQRVLTYRFDASPFLGGDIYLCADMGRIEILDSDDTQARLEIRLEASGQEATKAVTETTIATSFTSDGVRFSIEAWPTTLGVTTDEPLVWIHMRLTVPVSASYTVDATAGHGGVGVHQLSLERGRLGGFDGLKAKTRQGYSGGHDLDHVSVLGDLEINMPDGPIAGTLYALSSSRVTAHTNRGDIQLFFADDSQAGFEVVAGTNQGTVKVDIGPTETADDTRQQYVSERRARSQGYAEKPIQVNVEATTLAGNIVIASPK